MSKSSSSLSSAYIGGHDLRPHSDPEVARKGWLKCSLCGREVHGTVRAGGNWEHCRKAPPPVGSQIVYGNHQLRDVTGFYRNSLGDWMLRTRYFNGEVAEDVRLADATVLDRTFDS